MADSNYTYSFYSTTVEAWESMYQAIVAAKRSIYWEVYIFVDDKVGDKFIDALCQKARAKVEVKLVIDAFGGYNFSNAAQIKLQTAGVDVRFFNRLYPEFRLWRWLARVWYRNHRKVLIVDQNVVFLGGVNVEAHHHEWDDLYIKISGLVPRPLLRGFAKSYISSGGKKKNVKHLLKPFVRERWHDLKNKLSFIVHSPRFSRGNVSRKLYLRALEMAKESVNFLTPYYAPDKEFLRAIAAARKRGVRVNIFLPLRPDIKILDLIARAYFKISLKAGANLYLLPKMNHGKAITVDDKAGVVGSINVTPRSFNINQESGVFFSNKKMVSELNGIFNEYKKTAHLVDHAMLARRSWWTLVKEWLVSWLNRYV